MTKEELRKIVSQIKKYEIVNEFRNKEDVDKWLSGLNDKQIKNFISLDIEPREITFPTRYLIDVNLLNCDDYINRINAVSKIKNEDDWRVFNSLFHHNFLNSKNYYKDLEKISRDGVNRYALSIITEDVFIKSPYHDEDLELILNAKDNSDNDGDWLVAEALATVAGNKDSINSPYHRQDMKLIANSGSECLQMSGSYPEDSLNNLAINKVSLNDKYHLENMHILANNPIASRYLYNIMTDANIIRRKSYRDEVKALVNAKSDVKALAIYRYIANPSDLDRMDYYDVLSNTGLNLFNVGFLYRNVPRVSGRLNSNYLEYLELLNGVDDKFVLYVEMLLSNKDLFESGHQEEDLKLLLSITDEDIFTDLYSLMTDKDSLYGEHHSTDAKLISGTTNKEIRRLLLKKATNRYSVVSQNHRYDMVYITKLDLDNISKEIYKKMSYYLFTGAGIKDEEHISMLQQLYEGKIVDKNISILEHLNKLEEQGIEEVNVQEKIDINDDKNSNKGFARIRKIFRKR